MWPFSRKKEKKPVLASEVETSRNTPSPGRGMSKIVEDVSKQTSVSGKGKSGKVPAREQAEREEAEQRAAREQAEREEAEQRAAREEAEREEAEQLVAQVISDALAGLPAYALLAVSARMLRRALLVVPVYETNPSEDLLYQLKMAEYVAEKAEYLVGLSSNKPDSEPSKPYRYFQSQHSAHVLWPIIILNHTQSDIDRAISLVEEKPKPGEESLYPVIVNCVSGSLLNIVVRLFRTLAPHGPSFNIMWDSFYQDCQHLRAVTAERGLEHTSMISAEWLGDLWVGGRNPFTP